MAKSRTPRIRAPRGKEICPACLGFGDHGKDRPCDGCDDGFIPAGTAPARRRRWRAAR